MEYNSNNGFIIIRIDSFICVKDSSSVHGDEKTGDSFLDLEHFFFRENVKVKMDNVTIRENGEISLLFNLDQAGKEILLYILLKSITIERKMEAILFTWRCKSKDVNSSAWGSGNLWIIQVARKGICFYTY